jgi:hypothetical protein
MMQMRFRRLVLRPLSASSFVVAMLTGLACVLVVAIAPAVAGAVTQFGGFRAPYGVALDQASGDVDVTDLFDSRIDVFSGSGVLLSTIGSSGYGTGQFATEEGPLGVAVDNELGGLSYGDVYAVDFGNFRVEKFDSSGKFLSMFGGDVDETSSGDVCVAGEACKQGTSGTADGQFEWAFRGSYIAVGPDGRVYVGDRARVQVFEPSGVWRENISLAGLSATAKVSALTVNSSGDIFVQDGNAEATRDGNTEEGEVPGVREFEPDGVEMPVRFDEGSESVEALSLDESGDLFVADSDDGFHVLKYSPSGSELERFAPKAVTGTGGIVFSGASNQLYVSEGDVTDGGVLVLAVPPAGPLVESESVTPGSRGAATFAGSINPEGNATSYRFEYVDKARFLAEGFAGASSTPETSVGSGFEEQHAEAGLPVKTLTPGVVYHWRVVATDSKGHTSYGESQSFDEVPAAYVEGPWARDAAATSVTLAARIDPLGSNTEYRLEWGTSTSYGHVLSGNVGEGAGYVEVSHHLQELEPGTPYHYRLITTSEAGTVTGIDHTLTTQPGTSKEEPVLPDGRAWELVSPVEKGSALIQPTITSFPVIQAAADGSAIVYQASASTGENPAAYTGISMVMSGRGPDGWRSQDITRPVGLPPEGSTTPPFWEELGSTEPLFSADLSLGVTFQYEALAKPLSPEATEYTPYLRNNSTCDAQPQSCYTPLVTPGDIEPSTVHFGTIELPATERQGAGFQIASNVAGGTPDLSHIVLESPYALAAGAVTDLVGSKVVGEASVVSRNLYEWSGGGGKLQLVNVRPEDEGGKSEPGAHLGFDDTTAHFVPAHSISSDGRRIVWSYGTTGAIELFVRDMVEKRTLRIGGAHADFETMSSDGSRIFFREGGELYELNVDTGVQADLTANHGSGEANAGVQDAILGSSEEGCDLTATGECSVYFVAKGVLSGANAEGHAPVGGEDNLYVLHDGPGGWSTTYVATLSSDDENSWYANLENEEDPCDCLGVEHSRVSSRVSASGRYVTFMSDRSLTGYDNIDAVSAQPDEEVYQYDAVAKRLVCASCNPTGARPVGVLDGHAPGLLVDSEDAWGARETEGSNPGGEHWLAGMIPSWRRDITSEGSGGESFYQPRFLSDGGRLFFESSDGLVAQATNGVMDVYEYEPVGVGSCTVATSGGTSVYVPSENGCVSLMSSGTSSSESVFYDASETGDDVFFITASRLVPAADEVSYAVYDARVCSVSAPCPTVSVSSPPCTSGDSCKAAPSPQPEIFGAPPSATFNGVGNLTPLPLAKPKPKPKAKPKKCAKGKTRNKHGQCVKKAKSKKTKSKRGAKR